MNKKKNKDIINYDNDKKESAVIERASINVEKRKNKLTDNINMVKIENGKCIGVALKIEAGSKQYENFKKNGFEIKK